jgi:hypothetical protein
LLNLNSLISLKPVVNLTSISLISILGFSNMQFRQIVSTAVFSGLMAVASFSQALVVINGTTTAGSFVTALQTEYTNAGGSLAALANPQALYNGFDWDFDGFSVVGQNAAQGLEVRVSAYATAGTANQFNLEDLLTNTQINTLGGFLSSGGVNTLVGLASTVPGNTNLLGLALTQLSTAPVIAFLGETNAMTYASVLNGAAIARGHIDIQVSAIPEPGEWAMMLSGLAVVGAMARRRRKSIQ